MQESCSIDPELSEMEHGKHSRDTASRMPSEHSMAQAHDENATAMQETCSTYSEQLEMHPGELNTDKATLLTEKGQPVAQATDGNSLVESVVPASRKSQSVRLFKGTDLALERNNIWGQFYSEKGKIICPPQDQLPAKDAETSAIADQRNNGDSCSRISIESDCEKEASKNIPLKEDELAAKADDVPTDLGHSRAQEQQAKPPEQFSLVMPRNLTSGDLFTLLTERLQPCRLVAIFATRRPRELTDWKEIVRRLEDQRKRRRTKKLLYIKIETSTIEGGQVEYLLTKRETLERFAAGDLIVFQRFYGWYEHYAVYVGDGLVVHLIPTTKALRHLKMAEVKKQNLFEILDAGSRVRIESGSWNGIEPLPVPQIIERALSKVGAEGYHLLKYNCEHFARECRYGQPRSEQADNLMKWKAIQFHLAPTPMAAFVETSSWFIPLSLPS